jgi:hypothetical protein
MRRRPLRAQAEASLPRADLAAADGFERKDASAQHDGVPLRIDLKLPHRVVWLSWDMATIRAQLGHWLPVLAGLDWAAAEDASQFSCSVLQRGRSDPLRALMVAVLCHHQSASVPYQIGGQDLCCVHSDIAPRNHWLLKELK